VTSLIFAGNPSEVDKDSPAPRTIALEELQSEDRKKGYPDTFFQRLIICIYSQPSQQAQKGV
jgi:hypothetical protein